VAAFALFVGVSIALFRIAGGGRLAIALASLARTSVTRAVRWSVG